MKIPFLITLLFSLIANLYSQSEHNTQNRQQNRLYLEISNNSRIESECIALYCYTKSLIWKKADTLFSQLPLNSTLKYFDTSSHVIKYYAFLRILKFNDNVAFQKLQQVIADSSKVLFQFDDYGGEEKLNQILVSEYKMFIFSKYRNNSKLWKTKYSQLERLLLLHGLKPSK